MALSLLALGVTGVVAGSVMAEDQFSGEERPEPSDEMKAAVDAGDYDAFVEALAEQNPDAADNFDEERFNKIVEHRATKTAIDEAIDTGDYDAWIAAISELPHGEDMAEIVTEDEFPTLIQIHNLREEARELSQEIGLPERRHRGGEDRQRGPGGQMGERGERGQFDGEQNQRRGPGRQRGGFNR